MKLRYIHRSARYSRNCRESAGLETMNPDITRRREEGLTSGTVLSIFPAVLYSDIPFQGEIISSTSISPSLSLLFFIIPRAFVMENDSGPFLAPLSLVLLLFRAFIPRSSDRNNFSFPVVRQKYEVQVRDAYVLAGNTGVLRCEIPAFVKEYVAVTSWLKDSAFNIYPSAESGECAIILIAWPTCERNVTCELEIIYIYVSWWLSLLSAINRSFILAYFRLLNENRFLMLTHYLLFRAVVLKFWKLLLSHLTYFFYRFSKLFLPVRILVDRW